jgi:hypothetical protein
MATPTTLPAAFVAGNVLEASQLNNLRGAFRVLQVVQATNASTTTVSTNAYTAINLSASITPSATSSKILVFATVGAILKLNNTYTNMQLFRGATGVFVGGSYIGFTATALDTGQSASLTYLDSPSTTSATTYEIKVASGSNNSYVQVNAAATNSITLMEISA